MTTTLYTKNRILYWSIFIFVVGCFGFILAIYPVAVDDWWVLEEVRDCGILGTFKLRYLSDNSRIGNFLGISLIKAPRWIPKTICIFSFTLGFWLITKVCGLKSVQWKSLSLLSFLIWVAPMWEDSMFSHMYAFNYIVSIPLFFASIYLFIRPSICPIWVGGVIAFFLGCWHEAYGIVFFSGAILNFLTRSSSFTKYRLILVISCFLGLLWFAFTPAIYARSSSYYFIFYSLFKLYYCWIYLIYLVLWIFCYFKINKEIAKQPIQLFSLGSGIMLIIVARYGIARAFMPSILLCSCSMTIIISAIGTNINLSIKRFSAICLTSFTVISLILTCSETIKVTKMLNYVINIYAKSDKKTSYIFAPVTYIWHAPNLTLRRPENILEPFGKNMHYLYTYFNKVIFIIPEELQDYSGRKGEMISDNPNLRLYKGHIISSNVNDTAYHHCNIDYGLRTEYTEILRTIFTANDGNQYVYMLPVRSTISTYLGEPISIELVK